MCCGTQSHIGRSPLGPTQTAAPLLLGKTCRFHCHTDLPAYGSSAAVQTPLGPLRQARTKPDHHSQTPRHYTRTRRSSPLDQEAGPERAGSDLKVNHPTEKPKTAKAKKSANHGRGVLPRMPCRLIAGFLTHKSFLGTCSPPQMTASLLAKSYGFKHFTFLFNPVRPSPQKPRVAILSRNHVHGDSCEAKLASTLLRSAPQKPCTIGASPIRMGLWGPLYRNCNTEPPKIVGNYLGPYITSQDLDVERCARERGFTKKVYARPLLP